MVKLLEKNGKGLNLTEEVVDGILHHTGFSKLSQKAYTLEGQVVKYSDKIAYVNHDIDDSIRAGLLKHEDIPLEILKNLGSTHGERIDTLVKDIVLTTMDNIENNKVEVALSEDIDKSLTELRKFMFMKIYNGPVLKQERDKAKFVLYQVFGYFMKHPEEMPEVYKKVVKDEGIERGVTDYIAGMSDDYCLGAFNKLFVPKFVIY